MRPAGRIKALLRNNRKAQAPAINGDRRRFAETRCWPDELILSVPTPRVLGVVRVVRQDGCERGVEVVRWCETA